ncbi:hypothetical protein [Chitinimonas sp. JJ19]|uniref:hypothetical protein n=1 Tax=Chitinimonas sp. JJ19 TaxID=3109352 RepID=UPI002FFF4F61
MRAFKLLVDSLLRSMDEDFAALYSTTGSASILDVEVEVAEVTGHAEQEAALLMLQRNGADSAKRYQRLLHRHLIDPDYFVLYDSLRNHCLRQRGVVDLTDVE